LYLTENGVAAFKVVAFAALAHRHYLARDFPQEAEIAQRAR